MGRSCQFGGEATGDTKKAIERMEARMAIGEREKLESEVDRFAIDMKERLTEKQKEGYHGWDDDNNAEIITDNLVDNTLSAIREIDKNGYTREARKELTDVANLAFFLARFCD